MKKCDFCQHVGSDIGTYLFWLGAGSVICWRDVKASHPSALPAVQKVGGYCVALGSTNPSPRLCICPWDSAKQPGAAGHWHPLLKPAGEKMLVRTGSPGAAGRSCRIAVRCGLCAVPLAVPICAPTRRPLLSRLRASVEMSLFFPVIEEAVMTVMLKDKPGPPTLPPTPLTAQKKPT